MAKTAFAFVALPVLIGAISSCAERDVTSADSDRTDIADRSSAAPAESSPPADCDYISVEERVARCAGAYKFISRFITSNSSPACAPFYGLDPSGTRYASFEEVIASSGCETACLWHFSAAVDGLRCGHRWGYETLEAENQRCPTLYRLPEGYYTSLAEYEAAHPCP